MVDDNDSISGKPSREINEKIIKKLVVIKEDIIRKYQALLETSNLSHTKQILEELINLEKRDIELLENADSDKGVMYSVNRGKEEDLGLVDHLVSIDDKPLSDDPKSILSWSISKSDEIYKMADLLSKEYSEERIKKVLLNIAESEMKRKNRISLLYEDLINKNDW